MTRTIREKTYLSECVVWIKRYNSAMTIKQKKGAFVVLSLKPDWGRGIIHSILNGKVFLYFEGDPEHQLRKYSVHSEFLLMAENQDPKGFKKPVKKKSAKPKAAEEAETQVVAS